MKRAALATLAAAAVGCGGGAPLLHPARTLPNGDMRLSTGVAANAAVGSAADDVRTARDIAARDPQAPGAPGTNPAYAKGALVLAAIAPGLSPFVGARIGIGSAFEGGLAYTGRSVRVDLRRSFELGDNEDSVLAPSRRSGFTFSAGIGGSAALWGRQQGSDLPNVDLSSLRGYGADVPLLFGWQSNDGIYMVWTGVRGGFDFLSVEALTSEPKSTPVGTPPINLDARRFYGGGVFGLGTGFRHVHVALELQAAYQAVSGKYNDNRVSVSGLTISPATALWWTF